MLSASLDRLRLHDIKTQPNTCVLLAQQQRAAEILQWTWAGRIDTSLLAGGDAISLTCSNSSTLSLFHQHKKIFTDTYCKQTQHISVNKHLVADRHTHTTSHLHPREDQAFELCSTKQSVKVVVTQQSDSSEGETATSLKWRWGHRTTEQSNKTIPLK